jgi:hypothetical protein
MSTPSVDDLPQVVDPAVLTGLGDRLVSVANATQTSMADVQQRWSVLGDTEVFHVTGAEAVPRMLDSPASDARGFSEALVEARNALWDAESSEFPDLKQRREELASRIPSVVAAYDSAADASARANATYRSTRGSDVDASVAADASLARLNASTTLNSAESALDTLRSDIDRFRRDVEDAEDRLASRLRNVSGGTEVLGAGGELVRVAQLFWGFSESAYPGAPSAASVSRSLSEQLTYDLGRAAERRIDWLSTADTDDAQRWLDTHPDFVQSVAFVEPERAGDLFTDLAAASAAAPNGEWNGGPLGQLLALAPLVVGNLNGIPADQRGIFKPRGSRRRPGEGRPRRRDPQQARPIAFGRGEAFGRRFPADVVELLHRYRGVSARQHRVRGRRHRRSGNDPDAWHPDGSRFAAGVGTRQCGPAVGAFE